MQRNLVLKYQSSTGLVNLSRGARINLTQGIITSICSRRIRNEFTIANSSMTIVNFFFSDLSHMHFPSTFLNWSLFFKRLQSVRVGAAPTGHWFDSQHRAAPCSRALQQPSVLNPLLLADSCPTRLC